VTKIIGSVLKIFIADVLENLKLYLILVIKLNLPIPVAAQSKV
jgi:hypothetical protein